MRTLMFCLPVLLAAGGCGKDKAEQAVRDGLAKLAAEYRESNVAAHAERLVKAAEARDLPALKRLCDDQASADYSAIMGCYYNAFVIEDGQGVEAARAYLAAEAAKGDNTPARARAIGALRGYFAAKGSLRTKEVAALILVVGLEAKYGHRGGMIGKLIADRVGLTGPPKSGATMPASAPATGV